MKKKGIALITTIMIVLMLSLLTAGMMFTIKSETAISVYQAQSISVNSVAESALDEVKHRMNLDTSDSLYFIGDTLFPPNLDWQTIILFNNAPPADTGNTHFTKSLQNDLDSFPELNYTTVNYEKGVSLVIHHKLSEDSTQMYFFDSKTQKQFLDYPTAVVNYPPVEVVEITARSGNAVKKILAEVSQQRINIKVSSALSAATIVLRETGNADPYICGHNHDINTPYNVIPLDPEGPALSPAPHWPGAAPVTCWDDTLSGTGGQQVGYPRYHIPAPYDSVKHPSFNHYYYNPIANSWNIHRIEYDEFCTRAGCLAGIATTSSSISSFGESKSHIFGNPDIIVKYNIVVPELYEVLGFSSEGEMNDNITWENVLTLPTDTDNFRYFKITPPTGTWVGIPSGTQTKGIIWVNGNIDFKSGGGHNGYFQHKGLLYIQKDWTGNTSGNVDIWVLGAMVIKGTMDVKVTGRVRVFFMYSSLALEKTVESNLEYFKLLGWKEIN